MNNTIKDLEELARKIRLNVLEMTYKSGVNGGHLGGAFSSAEILAVLYGKILNITPETVCNENRDRFILSKGHISLGHYAVLAECGFITREEMLSFEESGTDFSTHELKNLNKGIEISSGSLGYGLSISTGIALSAKIQQKSFKTYVLMGDGECNEGCIWEAAMTASKYKLDNLVAIIDYNEQSLDGFTSDTMPIYDIAKVWEGFGWNIINIKDGNNIVELINAFNNIKTSSPNAIIAHTKKAKGLSSIEGKLGWHHARLNTEQYESFLKELGEKQ